MRAKTQFCLISPLYELPAQKRRKTILQLIVSDHFQKTASNTYEDLVKSSLINPPTLLGFVHKKRHLRELV